MVCASVHGADDWCWYIPFSFLLMHGNGLTSLGHDLHVSMHPFQATQHTLDGLVLGRFGKNAPDKNDTLWCVPLFVELMIAAGMFNLACDFVAVSSQATVTTCLL